MSRNSIIDRLFENKIQDSGVFGWCKRKKDYLKAMQTFNIYENKLLKLGKDRFSEKEYKEFEEMLSTYKGSIYDMELEEKKYYFKEGQKEGIQLIKELYE